MVQEWAPFNSSSRNFLTIHYFYYVIFRSSLITLRNGSVLSGWLSVNRYFNIFATPPLLEGRFFPNFKRCYQAIFRIFALFYFFRLPVMWPGIGVIGQITLFVIFPWSAGRVIRNFIRWYSTVIRTVARIPFFQFLIMWLEIGVKGHKLLFYISFFVIFFKHFRTCRSPPNRSWRLKFCPS